MGQYYKPIFLNKSKRPAAWVYSHDVKSKHTAFDGKTTYIGGEGLKLMEHSYINNSLVGIIENFLMPGGKFYKSPLVWAGDYADAETTKPMMNEDGKPMNLYQMCEDNTKVDVAGLQRKVGKKFRYILNWDKKQFVDKNNLTPIEPGFSLY